MLKLQATQTSGPMKPTTLSLRNLIPKNTTILAFGILLISAFCAQQVSFWSPIFSYAEMDPRGSTLVAQSLIERGTLNVDGYKLPAAPWLFEVKNGRTY